MRILPGAFGPRACGAAIGAPAWLVGPAQMHHFCHIPHAAGLAPHTVTWHLLAHTAHRCLRGKALAGLVWGLKPALPANSVPQPAAWGRPCGICGMPYNSANEFTCL